MTEILLLGTFHFAEERLDIYSSAVQDELDMLVERFVKFHPDAITVEGPSHAQQDIDKAYSKFMLDDLRDPAKMQHNTLGTIHIYGETYPISYLNESVQIAFRLGKQLGYPKIFAVDDDTLLDMRVLDTPSPSLQAAMAALADYESTHSGKSMVDKYRCLNGEAWSRLNHDTYIQVNAIATENPFAGAQMVAKWYERNLKIFSNIQKLAAVYNRIFVLYGAGHLQVLRDFIHADSNLKLLDVMDYL